MSHPRNPCESTYLSQSPIVERIYNENQEYKENKSLLEEYENMITITDDTEHKFFKENSVPKFRSFIYLLKEFGLDTYTLYNVSKLF